MEWGSTRPLSRAITKAICAWDKTERSYPYPCPGLRKKTVVVPSRGRASCHLLTHLLLLGRWPEDLTQTLALCTSHKRFWIPQDGLEVQQAWHPFPAFCTTDPIVTYLQPFQLRASTLTMIQKIVKQKCTIMHR